MAVIRRQILNECVKVNTFLRTHIVLVLKYISSGAETTLSQHVYKSGQLEPPIISMGCRPTVAPIRKMGRNECHESINPIEFRYYRDECTQSVGSETPKWWVRL